MVSLSTFSERVAFLVRIAVHSRLLSPRALSTTQDFDKAQNVLPLALQSLRESYQFTPQHRMALEKNIELLKQTKKPGSGNELAPLQKELDIVQTVQGKLEAGMSMDQIAMELQAGVARPAASGGRAALGASPRNSSSVGKPVNRKKMRKKKAL